MNKNDADYYIAELKSFTNIEPSRDALELNELDLNRAKNLGGISPVKSEIYDFSQKDYLENNIYTFFQDDSVTIWTPRTVIFGYFRLPSVRYFNFSFPFDSNSEGIVSILASDFSKRVVLDFSKENCKEVLEVDYFTYT